MKIVERIVRPVRASTPRKRKMREELLAHLSAIYDQELAKLGKPASALEAASRRLGDPAELARELEDALPCYKEGGPGFALVALQRGGGEGSGRQRVFSGCRMLENGYSPPPS